MTAGAQTFGVRIPPQLASRRESYQTSTPGGRQLAIVEQAYEDPVNQASIAALCRLFAAAGTRLVAVEDADRPLTRAPGQTDIAQLLRTGTVSAGVLSVLNAGDVPLTVWGVDDRSLIPPSHDAMRVVSANRGARDKLFEQLRRLLRAAQDRLYPTAVAAARRARLSLYGERAPATEQVRRLLAAAGGPALASYPLIRRFAEMMASGQRIRPERAEREARDFYDRLVGRIRSWYYPVDGNRLKVEWAQGAAVLQFWIDETGQSAEAVMRSLKAGNEAPMLLACRQWYDSWMTTMPLQSESYEIVEQLMRAALRLGVPYFELRDFRESVAQARDGERLKAGLDDQIGEAMSDLADRLPDPKAAALRELEDRFELLLLMAQLAVAPRDAELRVASRGALGEAVAELEHLAGRRLPTGLESAVDGVNEALEAASRFCDCSLRRSRHMVERTLSLLRQRREDRALLVVGGFHSRLVTRALDDHPDVSWAVLMPKVDVDAAWRRHHERF
jgi:hypothetical protein